MIRSYRLERRADADATPAWRVCDIMRRLVRLLGVFVAAAIIVACSQDGEQTAALESDSAPALSEWAAGFGSIAGVVRLRGMAPVWETDPCAGEGNSEGDGVMDHDHNACAESRSLVVDHSNGVMWAVASVNGVGEREPDSAVPELDQSGLQFVPHVLAVTVGQEVLIRNSDDVLHNVHVTTTAGTLFNRAMPTFSKEISHRFDEPGLYRVRCDVHPHMGGYILVMPTDTAYAVSAGDGSFELDRVPPGARNVQIWHETTGTVDLSVEVRADQVAAVSYELVLDASHDAGEDHTHGHDADSHGGEGAADHH